MFGLGVVNVGEVARKIRFSLTRFVFTGFLAPVSSLFSLYREGNLPTGVLWALSEKKGEGAGRGQSDHPASAMFSSSFSLRYAICWSAMFWVTWTSLNSCLLFILLCCLIFCQNPVGRYLWKTATSQKKVLGIRDDIVIIFIIWNNFYIHCVL